MFAEGFVVDKVVKLKSASQSGNIPNRWALLARRNAHAGEQWRQLPENYWGTLVADRGSNGNPPRHYPRLINYAIETHVRDDKFQTQRAIDHSDCQAAAEVLERVQAVIWNRRLVETESKRLGLVPEQARQGDLIVILYGCGVPVVLRRFEKTENEVKHEQETRWTRTQKKAARVIVPALRQNVKRQRERGAAKATFLAEQPMTQLKMASSKISETATTSRLHQKLDFSSSTHPTATQEVEIRDSQVGGCKPKPVEATGGQERDTDTASQHSEVLEVPGAWIGTPPVSRSNTVLVAPGPSLVNKTSKLLPEDIPRKNTTAVLIDTPAHTVPKGDKVKPTEEGITTTEPLLRADEYSYYQLIGECYLHGMMNGEAIPMQRAAEDDAKQQSLSGEQQELVTRLCEAQTKAAGASEDQFVKELQRAYTQSLDAIPGARPQIRGEPGLFLRTLFELR
jgi:hypothetical protein